MSIVNIKVVEVIYIDSNIINEQTDEIVEPEEIRAIGYLVEETRNYVTITRELVNSEYRGQISIPKVAILKKHEIEI